MLLGLSTPYNMQAVQVVGFLVSGPDQAVKNDSRDDDRKDERNCHGFTSLSLKIQVERNG